METIGAFQAKTHFSSLLERVEKGEQIIITKHGHAIAKLVPVTGPVREDLDETLQKLKAFATTNQLTLGNIDWKILRDEGRR